MRLKYDLIIDIEGLLYSLYRWLTPWVAGTSGHIHQCYGAGCAQPIREHHSCWALPLLALRAWRGSRLAWALTTRRYWSYRATAIGQTFSSRPGVCTRRWMFGRHLKSGHLWCFYKTNFTGTLIEIARGLIIATVLRSFLAFPLFLILRIADWWLKKRFEC